MTTNFNRWLNARRSYKLALTFGLSAGLMSATSFPDTGSLQTWTVPITGTYQIVATGGSGGNVPFRVLGNSDGGHGATVTGDYSLTQGDTLSILVGEAGHNASSSFDAYGAGGGGGASMVQDSTSGITYVVAGGGGGGGASSGEDGLDAGRNASAGVQPGPPISVAGSSGGGGAAGLNGGGGQGGQEGAGGGGGAGLNSSGAPSEGNHAGWGGVLLSGNAHGGANAGAGGFGGGGGGGGEASGGGGGGAGYNGGGGGVGGGGGGGGGSFSADLEAVFSAASGSGNGSVTITESTSTAPVPEPGEVGMLALAAGLVLLRIYRRHEHN